MILEYLKEIGADYIKDESNATKELIESHRFLRAQNAARWEWYREAPGWKRWLVRRIGLEWKIRI